jgi:hypothetical protein
MMEELGLSNGMSDLLSLGVLSSSKPIPASPPSAPTGPLVLLRQNSLTVEQIYKNGISKKVHVVVKNHPFLVQIGLAVPNWQGQRIDFHRFPVEARLVYDCDGGKEVGFVKMKPIEFKTNVNDRGDQVTVEIRPKVLTSQLEDSLFRVKIVATDPVKPLSVYSVLSESIRVVSKPEQVKKKAAKETPSPNAPKPRKEDTPKKPIEELLADHLARIESNVNQQDVLLSILSSKSPSPLPAVEERKVPEKRKYEDVVAEPVSPFEQSVMDFLEAFNRLDEFEKPMKLRKMVKNAHAGDIDLFTEMLEKFATESAVKQNEPAQPSKGHNGTGCQCDGCPHKEELLRIDEFYNRLLTNPDGVFV